MKLAANSVAPAILLGLCVALAGGCGSKKPPGTNPPGETDGGGKRGKAKKNGGADAGGDDGGGSVTDAGGEGGGDGGAAAPTTCEAQVADTPTLLFMDKVIFRPPAGVEFAPDDNPMVQTAMMSSGFMSACDGIIKRVVVNNFEANKKRTPAKLVEEFIESLDKQGYTNGKRSEAYVDSPTDYHLSVEYGAGGGGEAVVLYIAVARRNESDFVVVYESNVEDFTLLKATYEESAKSLFYVPEG